MMMCHSSPSRKQRTYKTATSRQGLGISNMIEENHVGGARALCGWQGGTTRAKETVRLTVLGVYQNRAGFTERDKPLQKLDER